MKNLLIIPVLALAACASPGMVPVAKGPVARTIERVLLRTEAYMEDPAVAEIVPAEVYERVEAAIKIARQMVLAPEANGALLLVTMSSIMLLHDQLVMRDPILDPLERAIYREDTTRLRSLFSSASIHQ